MKKLIKITAFCLLSLTFEPAVAQLSEVPGQHWQQYATPEEAGFSSEKLRVAEELFHTSEAAGAMVVYDGRVLAAWGETARRFRCASIRKSYLSALYGIYVAQGGIDPDKTLADLGIDDIEKLTPDEKQATVRDLLSARSGIYLPAAYSPRGMSANLPERGSHSPGTFWYYNNWDFNALCTIFEQETGIGVFEAFDKHIARPLQLEDFELRHTYYRYEPDKSQHPAYLFRMTARDMARIGLLYLNGGRWNRVQIIPKGWIEKSTSPVSHDLGSFANRGGYGYLWWISDGIDGKPMYFASGSGGQRICVLPESNLVFVHVVNTYNNNGVSQEQIMQLLSAIVASQTQPAKTKPGLVTYKAPESRMPETVTVNSDAWSEYSGTYRHRVLGEFTIKQQQDGLIMETMIGTFRLFPVSDNQFYPEDIETPLFFEKAETGEQRFTAASIFDDDRKLIKVVFRY